jgi:CDP-glucose 4,6-dehydratase
MDFAATYGGKTVLITGHTGFQGSWLSEWLLLVGAKVIGFSHDPPTDPSHFVAIGLHHDLTEDIRGDVRSFDAVRSVLCTYEPDFVFHLAAQPIVRRAFLEPHLTIETNFLGTLNVLEAARQIDKNCTVILATTDKVYENVDWVSAYRENDPLGGYDPYSAGKAAAEIIISSYQRTFYTYGRTPRIGVAAVRGGNVIGGGDWAQDRLVPNSIRRLTAGLPILVRNPRATRPWQHVLELVSGYLCLAAEISDAIATDAEPRLFELSSAFNFGPHLSSNQSVQVVVEEILRYWPGTWEYDKQPEQFREAGRLNVAIDKAYHLLGWAPRWGFEATIRNTINWYKHFYTPADSDRASIRALTREQIRSYTGDVSDTAS